MDLLKEEKGTTILVILLLGILTTLTVSFFSTIFNNKNMLKGRALQLAQQEISKSISEGSEHDTSYTKDMGNLLVRRIIYHEEYIEKVEVQVGRNGIEDPIISLKANYIKW